VEREHVDEKHVVSGPREAPGIHTRPAADIEHSCRRLRQKLLEQLERPYELEPIAPSISRPRSTPAA
jgi:hypothetical protein